MIKLLQEKVSDVQLPGGRRNLVLSFQLFREVDLKFQRTPVSVFRLLVIFQDLFFCIRKRVIGDLQEFRMASDSGGFFVVVFLPLRIPSWTK